MNRTNADEIVRAVLYEGYNLYPYRPSVKNRHRWTFGGLYPASYTGVREGSDAASFEMQCLVRGSELTRISVRVLFLHLRWRRIGKPPESACEFVDSLEVDSTLHQTWQEAVEREVLLDDLALAQLTAGRMQQTFHYSGSHEVEPIRDAAGNVAGLTIYDQQAIEGQCEISAERVEGDLYRLTLRVQNTSPLEDAINSDRDAVLLRTLASTNAVLHVEAGEFLSSTDPPESARAAAAACRNQGVWPVLLGAAGEHDTLLAVADHPLRLPADCPREPRRPVRRDGDRRNPDLADHDHDRGRKEGRQCC